jgi:hypothetical protein
VMKIIYVINGHGDENHLTKLAKLNEKKSLEINLYSHI